MALVVRTDLAMNKGKIAAQVAHAAVELFRKQVDSKSVAHWLRQGQPKVVLKVDSLAKIEALQEHANKLGLCNTVIYDAGHTQVPEGSLTVLGLGPETEDKINDIVGHLKLL